MTSTSIFFLFFNSFFSRRRRRWEIASKVSAMKRTTKTKESTRFISFQSEKAISNGMMTVGRVAVLNLEYIYLFRRIDSPQRQQQQQQPPSTRFSSQQYIKKRRVRLVAPRALMIGKRKLPLFASSYTPHLY